MVELEPLACLCYYHNNYYLLLPIIIIHTEHECQIFKEFSSSKAIWQKCSHSHYSQHYFHHVLVAADYRSDYWLWLCRLQS